MFKSSKQLIENLLDIADVRVNGDRLWDIQVNNENFFSRVLYKGSLGLGESYMDGWWNAAELDQFFSKILSAQLDTKVRFSYAAISIFLRSYIFNLQTKTGSFKVGKHHYDMGNNLYGAMLDKRLTYTCGYWKSAASLDEAQEHKLDLVCRKIGLKSGDKVLDIGCGWGSFAKFAAERYNARVVGITVSKEQVALGKELCKGLSVELRLQDYRDVNEKFDHIISLGMIEHVGAKNYRTYMEVVERCLKDDGLFLLHTIGNNRSVHSIDPWMEKYIFPNSMTPSIMHIAKASEGLFVMEDWHNFGADYDRTLMAWFNNFDNAWPRLKNEYSERFYRMWKYYLLSCAGTFRSRRSQLWQIILSKRGIPGGYKSIR